MADTSLGRFPELFARMALSHGGERETVLADEMSRIKMDAVRRGTLGGSAMFGQYHKACQTEMDVRGAEMLINLRRIVSDIRLAPSPGMAEALKGIFRAYLVREADKLTEMAYPKSEAGSRIMGIQAVRPKCEKYDVEIDLFVEALSATAAIPSTASPVSVSATDGALVLVQVGGLGNTQSIGSNSGGLAVVDALVGQLRERVRPGFAISDEAIKELAPMVDGLLTEAGRYHGNMLLVQALRDYKNTLDWILHHHGNFDSAADLDAVKRELEKHYQACVMAIRDLRNASAPVVTDASNA